MALWKVPGLAVAVVKDGRLVLARGYGVRELGKPARVDPDTLFTIASNSKAFTAASLGTLVSAGKLKWDARVVRYLPDFRLASAYVTQEITLRDLLSHRSGYCDPTMMWYTSRDTADNVIRRLRFQRPRYGFRAHFCYNNTMYLAASRLIPAITGESWNRYVTAHFFAPLGMTRTVTTTEALERTTDVAAPHGRVDGRIRVIRRFWAPDADVFAPVGNINSSVNDMSHWLVMLLADGRYRGRTVLDPAVIAAMESPQAIVQADSGLGRWMRTQTPHSRFYAYGLGFMLQEYGGEKLVWHAGDIDGMASALGMLPHEHLGVVVLSNLNGNRAPEGVMFYVLQSYLGLPHRDVSRAMFAFVRKQRDAERAKARRLAATRQPGTKPPLPLGAYSGQYSDDFYGSARVSEAHGRLVIRLGNPMFTGDMQPWHGNTFRVLWRYHFYGKSYATFGVDALGQVVGLSFADMPVHYERVHSGGTPAAGG
jgi:CubicO group peptidase (beta-lactamase class C family)